MIHISYANVFANRKKRPYKKVQKKPVVNFTTYYNRGVLKYKLRLNTGIRNIVGSERCCTIEYTEDNGNGMLHIHFFAKPDNYKMRQGVYTMDKYGNICINAIGCILKEFVEVGKYSKFVYDAERDILIVTTKENNNA